MIEALF